MPLHPAKILFDSPDPPADPSAWASTLAQAFANPCQTDGFLAEAEKAERACPGDPIILCQAATAALLDRRPDKAQLYLKRYTKRYAARKPYYLLSALTLAAQKKLIAARAMLERHDLTNWRMAMGSFPGGWGRRRWLAERTRRHHGSRASAPGAPASGQARSCPCPRENSVVDQIPRAAAGASAAGESAGDADLGAAAGRHPAGRQI